MKVPLRCSWAILATTVGLAAAIAGCGSSSSSSSPSGGSPGTSSSASAGSSGTVPVSVGTSTIQLPKGHLNVCVFMNSQTNQWQEDVASAATAAAKEHGASVTVYNGNFDVSQQRNQLQNAATNHSCNAAFVVAVDGAGECTILSKTLPAAGVLVGVGATQICNRANEAGNAMWQPGTLNFVGGDGRSPTTRRSSPPQGS